MVEVIQIPAEATRELRHRILRPHQPIEEAIFSYDDHPDSFHAGARINGQLVGAATIHHEDRLGVLEKGIWRVRGMCVLPEFQRKDIGKRLLNLCMDHARNRGGISVWCNARTSASEFYKRCGFQPDGPEFDIPGIGPHYVFVKNLGNS